MLTGVLSVAAVSFQSCGDDWLDLKPEGRPVGNEVTVGGFEAQAFGLYAGLREQSGVSDFTYVWTHGIRADDNEKGSTASDAATDGNVLIILPTVLTMVTLVPTGTDITKLFMMLTNLSTMLRLLVIPLLELRSMLLKLK